MSGDTRLDTDHGETALRGMSEAPPDMSTFMKRVGDRWWHPSCASRGGDGNLAAFDYSRADKVRTSQHRQIGR